MSKLLDRTVEHEPDFGNTFVFGYFDAPPSYEEMGRAYFEDGLPDDWATRSDLAAHGDPSPKLVEGRWRVLLGEDN